MANLWDTMAALESGQRQELIYAERAKNLESDSTFWCERTAHQDTSEILPLWHVVCISQSVNPKHWVSSSPQAAERMLRHCKGPVASKLSDIVSIYHKALGHADAKELLTSHQPVCGVMTTLKWFSDWASKNEVNFDDNEANRATFSAPLNSNGADINLLATRQQLIDAFGSITGMNLSWFRNLKYTPRLKDACKRPGRGGKGHIIQPLFCPFEVMLWLVDKKRKTGKPIGDFTAWRMLKAHFPKVYAIHADAAPPPIERGKPTYSAG